MKSLHSLFKSPMIMTWASSLVKFGSALFVLPIILLQFSEAEVAIWLLFNLVISLSFVADSGFGPTMIRAASYYYSGSNKIPGNVEEFKKQYQAIADINYKGLMTLLNTYNSSYLILGVFSILLLLTIGQFIITNVISLSNNQDQLFMAYYVLVVRSFFGIQYIKWSSFIQGIDKVADIKKAETVTETGKLITMFILLLLGGKILELMVIDLIFSISIYIYSKYYVKKWFNAKGHKYTPKLKFNGALFKTLWPANWRFAGMQYGSFMIVNGTSIIVSQLNDPRLISSFLLTNKFILYIRQISQAPIVANLPKIFQMLAQNNIKRLKLFCAEKILLGLIIQILLLLIFIFFGPTIISFMDIKTSLLPISLIFVMSISITLELHHGFHAQIYMGSNHVPFLLPGLISGIIILGIGSYVISQYGLIALVLTQLLVQLSFNNWYPVYLNLKLLDWGLSDYFLTIFSKKNFGLE